MSLTLIPKKGLILRNTHVKYECFITYHSKVMTQTDKQTEKEMGQKLYSTHLSMCGHEKENLKFFWNSFGKNGRNK